MESAQFHPVEDGAGDELSAALATVSQATVGGGARFSPRTTRELARVIACRNYGPAVLELCHLAVAAAAADRAGHRYETLLWGTGVARASAFQAFFLRARPVPKAIGIGEGALSLGYPEGPFVISYGRMPFLASLAEFLMTALGYAEMDERLAPLGRTIPDRASVEAAANALNRRLYDYLRRSLPSAQAQRKVRSLTRFLARRHNTVGPETIDDDAILDFWIEISPSPEGGADFKAYRTVFRTAVQLVEALRAAVARRSLDRPRTLGGDREAGETDPGDILDAVTAIDETPDLLRLLAEPPLDRIKFLNQREIDIAECLKAGGGEVERLAASVLRNAVFGRAQARITNFLRGRPDAAALAQFIRGAPDTDYGGQLDLFAELLAHVERVLRASLHVLLQARRKEAVSLALDLLPNLDVGWLDPAGGEPDWRDDKVVSLRGRRAIDRFFEGLAKPETLEGPLKDAIGEARAAFKALSRKGFGESEIAEAEVADGFAAGSAALVGLRRELATFLGRVEPANDWSRRFEGDRTRFENQFQILYGGADGDHRLEA